jgi:signal peptidase I
MTEPTPETIAPPASTPFIPDKWRALWENAQILIVALILALLVRSFVAEPRFIPSESMVPTLEIGDRLVVEKVSYRLHPPRRGDIVVFEPPLALQSAGYRADQAFIKRVVGLPGDAVAVRQGQVYINDQPLPEPYMNEPPAYDCPSRDCFVAAGQTFEVPADRYFVMGDNRNRSNDSHMWGFLPKQNVIGRAYVRFWPLGRLAKF